MFLFKYIFIFSLGGTFGVIVMCLVQAGAQADSKMKKHHQNKSL
ncbi:TPA: DUF3789 domain-containing protein [Listeria monocytogenes]